MTSGATQHVHDSRDRKENDRDEENQLGDANGCASDAAEAEDGGNQGDNKESDGPREHDWFLSVSGVRAGEHGPSAR